MTTPGFFVPIIWALVALLGAFIVNYTIGRRANAPQGQPEAGAGFTTKWLRIPGSVLAGGALFAAMWFATPRSWLEPGDGATRVQQGRLDELTALAEKLDANVANAEKFCVDQAKNEFLCMQAIREARAASLGLSDLSTQIRKPREP